MKLTKPALTLLSTAFLFSCSTDLHEYRDETPTFDIKEYFNGKVIAHGMVQNLSNKVNRRFCVEIDGTWQGNTGVLAEKFYFQDGEISYRNWQLTKDDSGVYQGTAEDVAGTAVGKHQGFAFQFKYDLLLNLDGETYQVAMDDWMYQLDPYRVVNKTTMTKLGVTVANITLFFDKQTPHQTCEI